MNLTLIQNYLSKLELNNEREWFKTNKNEYENARREFLSLIQEIVFGINEFDNAVGLIDPENCIFRIYRDVRFSKNKTPYKTFFSAGLSPKGKKGEISYYFSIGAPNSSDSFLGGGIFMPEKQMLNQIRKYISNNFEEFEDIVLTKSFETDLGGLYDDKLIRNPKGFEEYNPAIQYLKYKSFAVGKVIEQKTLESKNIEKKIVKHFEKMLPLIEYLRNSLKS